LKITIKTKKGGVVFTPPFSNSNALNKAWFQPVC
jgi:hypothetical protein